MKFIKTHPTLILIIVSSILISSAILYWYGLDVLQKIFSILGSLSLGIALAAYVHNKTQNINMAVIEQISFFRKEVIPEWTKVSKMILEKKPDYPFSKIQLEETNFEFMRKRYSRNFKEQQDIFLNDLSKIQIGSQIWDTDILDSQLMLFNMMEEFSLRVFHFKTNQHKALFSVHAAFVDIVEKNAVALIFGREVFMGNPIYSQTLWLYNSWKGQINRSWFVDRLAKNKFITEDQRNNLSDK